MRRMYFIFTVCLCGRRVIVDVSLSVLAVEVDPLELVDKGRDERVHLDGLTREDLQDFADALVVLDHAELDEETGQTVLVVLLRGLGVVPRELLKLQA